MLEKRVNLGIEEGKRYGLCFDDFFCSIWYLTITIDANAMLVGIMNPVYFQMCADMVLQRYIHKEKGKDEEVEINENPNDKLPSKHNQNAL